MIFNFASFVYFQYFRNWKPPWTYHTHIFCHGSSLNATIRKFDQTSLPYIFRNMIGKSLKICLVLKIEFDLPSLNLFNVKDTLSTWWFEVMHSNIGTHLMGIYVYKLSIQFYVIYTNQNNNRQKRILNGWLLSPVTILTPRFL